VIQDAAGEQVCILINPAPTPEVPHSDDYALVVFKRGWQGYETVWHATSKQEATAYFVNEGEDGRAFVGFFMAGSFSTRHIAVLVNGKEVGGEPLNPKEAKNLTFRVAAKHGRNEIVFKTDAPPAARSGGLPVTFMIGNLKFTGEPQ